jgi:hypothetical protein
MKKNIMSVAVASALVIGGTSAFGAMHVNDRGLGEALIYPFYSASNASDDLSGNDTYIHIVNTTNLVKAVKVRFIEAQNSQEVLDFNLYLSPYDEWAGTVTRNPNGTEGDVGAIVRTQDNSCTVPALGTSGGANVGVYAGTTRYISLIDGEVEEISEADYDPSRGDRVIRDQPFVPFKFNDDYVVTDPEETDQSDSRTLEGYVEIIEMGQLLATSVKGAASVHDNNGVPADCGTLRAAWATVPEGVWRQDPQDELLTDNGGPWDGGGLYGYGVVINVNAGAAAGYDAYTIDQFNEIVRPRPLHFPPGNENPSLDNAQNLISVFNEGVSQEYLFDSGLDAVSALMMTTSIANDYVTDPGINAVTDWVVTMPTKRAYVNRPEPLLAEEPFSSIWNGTTACEPVVMAQWDREESFTPPPEEGENFSPQPPGVTPGDFSLCTEVSVISWGDRSALSASSSIRYGFEPEDYDGWAQLVFTSELLNTPIDNRRVLFGLQVGEPDGIAEFSGLPAIGFAVLNYQNGELIGAVTPGGPVATTILSNYAAAVDHKTVSSVELIID